MSPADAARREDFRAILGLVRPGARVLDIGCGEGVLLDMLGRENGVEGRGLEINAAGARVSFLEIDSDKGHDAFLLDEPVMRSAVAGFLDFAGSTRGLT